MSLSELRFLKKVEIMLRMLWRELFICFFPTYLWLREAAIPTMLLQRGDQKWGCWQAEGKGRENLAATLKHDEKRQETSQAGMPGNGQATEQGFAVPLDSQTYVRMKKPF